MSMGSSSQPSKRKAPTEEAGPADYVHFSIKGQDGRQLFFKVNKEAKLFNAFSSYCERVNLEYETMQFLHDGQYVKGKRQTPKMLNLKNGDEIVAVRHQSGGGVA
ncbi:small ubiquitin-related modifier 1-like [Lotus japonicus]|uniref:small ubiquitin-related modifier 1-like n=1 Tax=Lotus japonicus TaxID=34305 RepID=UPI0025829C8D|nr:small ubiquitin-related modifier 1-like [Lotus japonicus]